MEMGKDAGSTEINMERKQKTNGAPEESAYRASNLAKAGVRHT